MPEVREGILEGGLSYVSLGDGPPLAVFPGLALSNANPTGLQRRFEVRFLLALLARSFTVYRINRKIGLGPATTVADLAADYAGALRDRFGRPLDVLGISTGGSIALQFAVDHPDLLRRLVVAGSAYRLGHRGQEAQQRIAEVAPLSRRRQAFQQMAPALVESRLGQRLVGGLLWLLGPLVVGRDWDPSDMTATIRAEDAFDLGNRLAEIAAPTLVIGGIRDRFYTPELFEQTAERIPNARLHLYHGRGHGGTFTDRRFASDIIAFLRTEHPAP